MLDDLVARSQGAGQKEPTPSSNQPDAVIQFVCYRRSSGTPNSRYAAKKPINNSTPKIGSQ